MSSKTSCGVPVRSSQLSLIWWITNADYVQASSWIMEKWITNGSLPVDCCLSNLHAALGCNGIRSIQDRQSVYAQLLSRSGELPSRSLSGNAILSSVTLCEVLSQCCKAAFLSACRIGVLSVHYSAAYGSVFTCCRDASCCVHFKCRPASPVRCGTNFPL